MLVTGGLGFIGSNFIRFQLQNYEGLKIVNLDKLTYAGNPLNLKDIEKDERYQFVKGDICDKALVQRLFQQGFDAVVNFAAESHVDRSILSAEPFLRTNVLGVQVLLDAVNEYKVERFVQVSTDEVYGSIEPPHSFKEEDCLRPSSPYAASKASADLLCKSYFVTHNTPVIITRSTNNYGPYQFPEKLIPLMITKALANEQLPVYGDGGNIRDWLYVEDNCKAIDAVLRRGKVGEVYNVGAGNEKSNLEVVRMILAILSKPESLISFVADRPGHDLRYSLDCKKIERELGWKCEVGFEEGLRKTVRWYIENKDWLDSIKLGTYQVGW